MKYYRLHIYQSVRLKILTLDISNPICLNSQLTFTCSISAIETLEKGVKYVQD